jgi:hypothetical protein
VVFNIDCEEIVEAAIAVELDVVLFVCVCARATGPEINSERRARKATVTIMEMLIFSPKSVAFTPK